MQTLFWEPLQVNDIFLIDPHVHIWCLPLNIPENIIQSIFPVLSPYEFSKAGRYSFSRDRNRFVVRRALLRILLGYYTDMRPENVRFVHNEYGKPKLYSGLENNICVEFSVSTSYNMAIYAVCKNRGVGIDVEKIRNIHEFASIAEQIFPKLDRVHLMSISDEKKQELFFALWTRMEAHLKALGTGFLFQNSTRLELPTLLPEYERVNLLKWRFWNFSPKPGYIASLALDDQKETKILCFDWHNFREVLLKL